MLRGMILSLMILLSVDARADTQDANMEDFSTVWLIKNYDIGIMIPTDPAYAYAYSIDWGDGKRQSGLTKSAVHVYDKSGKYTVRIRGKFPHLLMATGNVLSSSNGVQARNAAKLLRVLSWGKIEWRSMENMFAHCSNMTMDTASVPDLSHVSSMKNMFAGATRFDSDIHDWNVSTVTDMSGMFYEATAFNQPLNSWNTSHVTTMRGLFGHATHFNQPLHDWDLSSVRDMAGMFEGAADFDQALNDWNVSRVADMSEMFAFARRFNHPLDHWDTAQVVNMRKMFRFARAFHDQDLSHWSVRRVTRHSGFFQRAGINNQEPHWP